MNRRALFSPRMIVVVAAGFVAGACSEGASVSALPIDGGVDPTVVSPDAGSAIDPPPPAPRDCAKAPKQSDKQIAYKTLGNFKMHCRRFENKDAAELAENPLPSKLKWGYCIFVDRFGENSKDVMYFMHGSSMTENMLPALVALNGAWKRESKKPPIIVAITFIDRGAEASLPVGPIINSIVYRSILKLQPYDWFLTPRDTNYGTERSGLYDVFADEVMPAVEQHASVNFCAGKGGGERLLLGLSMGGFNAAPVTFGDKTRHKFKRVAFIDSAVFEVSPYDALVWTDYGKFVHGKGSDPISAAATYNGLRDRFLKLYFDLSKSGGSEYYKTAINPFELAKKIDGQSADVLVFASSDDLRLYKPNCAFYQRIKDAAAQKKLSKNVFWLKSGDRHGMALIFNSGVSRNVVKFLSGEKITESPLPADCFYPGIGKW